MHKLTDDVKVLITGGCGFIGSHFIRLLVNSGYNPVIIDKMTYASDINRLEDNRSRYKLYIGDICDRKLIEKIIRENCIETIINFAAETHVDKAIENSENFVYSNFIGVKMLLDICRIHNTKLVQISTDEVYGSISTGSFKENANLNPGNPYSATKAAADLLCLSYYNTYDLNIVITRSSNNYGPWQHSEKFIPRMIGLAIKKKPLEIYGNGENIRNWLYVMDNCKGIKLVMENGKKGEIYNLCGDNELKNNDVAKLIATKFNVPIQYTSDRLGHDFRYSIDCSKIKKELGWKAIKNFEDGLEETMKHYLAIKNI